MTVDGKRNRFSPLPLTFNCVRGCVKKCGLVVQSSSKIGGNFFPRESQWNRSLTRFELV